MSPEAYPLKPDHITATAIAKRVDAALIKIVDSLTASGMAESIAEQEVYEAAGRALARYLHGMGRPARMTAWVDEPDMDATDGAHPAWWRGNDAGVESTCVAVHRALDGKDDGAGVAAEPWESLRRRLLAMARLPDPRDVIADRPRVEEGTVGPLETKLVRANVEHSHGYARVWVEGSEHSDIAVLAPDGMDALCSWWARIRASRTTG